MPLNLEQFKNHQVTIHETVEIGGIPFEFLRWRKPGTVCGLINFILKGHELIVTGDWYESIYVWSEPVELSWIAKLDMQYFNSKCQASPQGRVPRDWSSDECMLQMRAQIHQERVEDSNEWPKHLREYCTETSDTMCNEDCDVCVAHATKKVEAYWDKRLEESGADSASSSKHEWFRWLENTANLGDITPDEESRYGIAPCNGELFLGEDWMHGHPEGNVMSHASEVHLEALKLALAWEEKNNGNDKSIK